MHEVEPCGCKSNGTHWLLRCPYHARSDIEHTAAFNERRSVRPEREWWVGNAEGLV